MWREFDILQAPGVAPVTPFSRVVALRVPRCIGASAVDFGCGSGVLSLALIARGATYVVAVDRDPEALRLTRRNVERALASLGRRDVTIEYVRADGMGQLPASFGRESFDLIVSNPATLPSSPFTPPYFDGGRLGRRMLDALIVVASRLLRAQGRLFFVQSSLAGVGCTEDKLCSSGFRVTRIHPCKQIALRPFHAALLRSKPHRAVDLAAASRRSDRVESLVLIDAERRADLRSRQ